MRMHSHSNWFWERMYDGRVRITIRDVGGNVKVEHILQPEAWASLVASVSLRGETGETYSEALERHMRIEP